MDLEDLTAFVRNERRCCPFLRFSIEQEPEEGPLWLYLTGPTGTKDFLTRTFPLDRRAGAGGRRERRGRERDETTV